MQKAKGITLKQRWNALSVARFRAIPAFFASLQEVPVPLPPEISLRGLSARMSCRAGGHWAIHETRSHRCNALFELTQPDLYTLARLSNIQKDSGLSSTLVLFDLQLVISNCLHIQASDMSRRIQLFSGHLCTQRIVTPLVYCKF